MRQPKLKFSSRLSALALAAALLATLSGCWGSYSNMGLFEVQPQRGTSEIDLLRGYGAPSYSTFVGDQKVHVYKVRDVKYILLFGFYGGYDLVITCQNGNISDVRVLDRPKSFVFGQPSPWAVAE
jgi:hypothetical protein